MKNFINLKTRFVLLFFIFFLSFNSLSSRAQETGFDQTRFFLGFHLYAALDDSKYHTTIHGALGPQFNLGNNWYLNRGNFHGVLKLTWLRAGIHIGDGAGLFFSPLNIGLGHQFQLKNNFSITPTTSFAVVGVGDDVIHTTWSFKAAVVTELAINFSGNASLVIEYAQRPYLGFEKPYSGNDSDEIEGYVRYISLGFRARLGSISQ